MTVTAKEKSVDVGLDVTKQLITLASIIIPLAIGLIGLRYPANSSIIPKDVLTGLFVSLILYLISITAGLILHFGVVAELMHSSDYDIMNKLSVLFPAMIQQILFLLGTLALIFSVYFALM